VENGKCGKWESEIRAKDIENTTSSMEVNWVWVFYVWEGPFLGWMKTGLPPSTSIRITLQKYFWIFRTCNAHTLTAR